MRCNSLLNNYCYIIISWLPVLLLETEKCNSWNECIGNDMFCSKETFSDSMWLFTGGFVWCFSSPPPRFRPSFQGFLLLLRDAVPSGRLKGIRSSFTIGFVSLVPSSYLSSILSWCHSTVQYWEAPSINKQNGYPDQGKCPWACCALCLDCSWEGVPLGCPVAILCSVISQCPIQIVEFFMVVLNGEPRKFAGTGCLL